MCVLKSISISIARELALQVGFSGSRSLAIQLAAYPLKETKFRIELPQDKLLLAQKDYIVEFLPKYVKTRPN